jgi:AAA family ATP:ADP antiporter
MASDNSTDGEPAPAKGGWLAAKALVLFANFFLIILAYYQVKAASRSLVLEHFDPNAFPWLWIVTAVVLLAFIGIYHRIVERHPRLTVVLASCVVFIGLLVGFRILFTVHGPSAAVGFYVLVDIFSVVLVEQFWSLTNTITSSDEGRRSYWFVGSGGLAGGVAGGVFSAGLLTYTPMTTPDLLLSCAGCLVLVIVLNLWMSRLGLYREVAPAGDGPVPVSAAGGWRALAGSRYLILIAALLMCAQLAQPIVEYQFLDAVNQAYPERDTRTTFISWFFSVLGIASIGVNLVLTPLIHRFLGVFAGLATQPLVLMLFSVGFMAQPALWMAGAMKIADRGLSYSINRASKELLYIPVDPVRTYQAKAWIDMLGYRLFKVLGSVLIIGFIQVLSVAQLGWLTVAICLLWLTLIGALAREYARVLPAPSGTMIRAANSS